KLEERVKHPADLAHIVLRRPMAPERVELVEEVDAACALKRVEDDAELRGRLAHELRDDTVEEEGEEGLRKLARERAGGERLPGPGRPDEEDFAPRGEAVGEELL